jgi:hypothetical protein
MRHSIRTLVLLLTLLGGTAVATTLYANEDQAPGSADRDHNGMMRDRGSMTGRTSRMMEHCGGMMRGHMDADRPNEQWRGRAPDGEN